MIAFTIPLRTVSETNQREHHFARHRRRAGQRHDARAFTLRALSGIRWELPLEITLTRVGPTKGLDSDNLPSSCKGLRDGIADALMVDDGDARLTWVYAQRRAKAWGVEVRITRRAEVAA